MPSTITPGSPDDPGHTGSDLFTRLCIRSCEGDDGARPGACSIWYRSPAIELVPDPPLRQGQPAIVRVTIDNFGTLDATAAWLELSYNVWLGNQPEANVPIATQALPVIPARGQITVDVPWTPPTVASTHACVHARVMDIYSMVTGTAHSWDPRVNPAVANHNVQLVVIDDERKPIVVRFPIRNLSRRGEVVTVLVTRHDEHARVRQRARPDEPTGVDEAFPLPFIPDLVRGRVADHPMVEAARQRAWFPRPEVHPAFVHARFGFDEAVRPGVPERPSGHVDAIADRQLASLRRLRLAAEQEGHVELVLPAEELPGRGRRARFEVHVQRGGGAPVVHHVYVTR